MLATLLLTATCAVSWSHGLPGPDNKLACTPGSADHLSRAQVCTPKDRPYTPVAVRREVLALYGVPNWTGANGEIDHRVPFALGGRTNRENLWPEPGTIPNQKDRLEFYVWRRICIRHSMRVRTARRIFLGDWRAYYFYYHLNR